MGGSLSLSLPLPPSLPPSLPLWNFPKMDLFSFPRGDTRRHLSGAHQTRQLPRFKSQTLIALKFEPEPHRNRTGTAPEPHRNRTGTAPEPHRTSQWNFLPSQTDFFNLTKLIIYLKKKIQTLTSNLFLKKLLFKLIVDY